MKKTTTTSLLLGVLLLVVSILLSTTTTLVSATWTVTLPASRSSIFETNLGGVSTDSVRIVARNSAARFDSAMQTDRSVFPGNCYSDQENL